MEKEELFNLLLPNRELSYLQAEQELSDLIIESYEILNHLDDFSNFYPYIGTSGGKDSIVVHAVTMQWLKRNKFHQNMPVIHTTKPNEVHPLTKEFLYTRPYPITYVSKEQHVEYIKSFGHGLQIDGSRISESNRTERSTTIVFEGKDISRENMQPIVRNGLFGFTFMYPILNWKDEHVWAYILSNNIEFSDEYLISIEEGYIPYA